MAKFEFDLGPIQDVIKELGNIDGVAPRMLKATGPIVLLPQPLVIFFLHDRYYFVLTVSDSGR